MIEIVEPGQMRQWTRARRSEGRTVGFVATMGALHEGHRRLIDRARERTDAVVVSVFVNRLQFGPREDFQRYPRDLEKDRKAALQHGAACLFAPSDDVMYGEASLVRVVPLTLANHLCGPYRPGHFEGVLTIVAKLFHIIEPDVAVFGRKDAQQAAIIRRMVSDLNFPVAIDIAPTVREADGLALSSRNAYLAPDERRAAPMLARALDAAHAAFRGATRASSALEGIVRDTTATEPLLRLQYVQAVDPDTLQPVDQAEDTTLLALAALVGETRLIDNIVVGRGTSADPRVR